MGQRIWRVKVDRQKLHMKQRFKKEKICCTERICYDEIDRKIIKDIHLRFGHASEIKMKMFLEEFEMNNNLRTKDTVEVIENIIANCTACNETGNIRNFLTPRSKDFNDLLSFDLADWTDQKVTLLHMIDEFLRYSVVTVVESKKPGIIMENILIGWPMRFDIPVSFLHDLGGEFKNDLIILWMSYYNHS